MDSVDELARKLISAFEPLGEEVILEQLAVPEDLANSQECVDLWVVSPGVYEEQFVARGQVSLPTSVVLEREVEELSRLFRQKLLRSAEFRQATTAAGVASRAADQHGTPSAEEAEQN